MSTDDTVGTAGRLGRALGRALEGSRPAQTLYEDSFLVGYDHREKEVHIPWPGRDGKLYVVLGARGTGKTVLLSRMQAAAIERGWSVLTIDAKGDPRLRDPRAARWTHEGPRSYNAYGHGSSMEIADKVVAGEDYTEPHYERQGQRFVGHLVRFLRRWEIEVSLASIVMYFDKDVLLKKLDTPGAPNTPEDKKLKRYLRNLSAEQVKGLAGMRDRLAIIPESELGRWWESGPDSINLWEATQRGEILHFVLDSDGIPLLSTMMSAALILDLNTLISRRNRVLAEGGTLDHLFVVIDEFGAIRADLSSIADRGRAAKVTLVLATQDLYSHTAKPEGLRGGLLANFDAMISLRQQSPLSARLVAEVSGYEEITKTSWSDDGDKRHSIDEMTCVRPGQIMRLPNYTAAVIVPSDPVDDGVRIARLVNPDA